MVKQSQIFWLAVCVFVGAVACGGVATKSARVAVVSIEGNASANSLVLDAVDRKYDLVSSKSYKRAASKLKAKSLQSNHVRKVSRKLRIQAVVDGEFLKKGKRRYELHLTFRAGDSGKEFDSIVIKLKSKKLQAKDRKRIRRELYSALSDVNGWANQSGELGDSGKRGSRVSASSSREERERSRKLRGKNHDRFRAREDRRDRKSAERKSRDDERRSRKRRKSRDDDDMDEDDEDDERRSRKRRKSRDDDDMDEDDEDDERRSRKRRKSRDDDDMDEDDEDDERRSRKRRKSRDDDDRRSKKPTKKKRQKKRRNRDEKYEVVTERDSSGQALDDESPF